MMNRAIFPLPLVLFPGGVTKLRIFEQRYLRMVKESAGDNGFILTTHDNKNAHNTSMVGSWVKIIDFQTLDDGMLGIDIQAIEAVELGEISVDEDKLCRAEVTAVSHWAAMPHNDITTGLAEKLSKLLEENNDLSAIYPTPSLNDASWVCARWIELLPILPAQKLHFFNANSYQEAVSLLSGILQTKN